MILVNTGPLVALADESDPHAARISGALSAVSEPLLTTQACLTEALYLLFRDGGWRAQVSLWNLILRDGLLTVHAPSGQDELAHAAAYMERFRDQSCDYADATLLVAADETGCRRVLTIDGHFFAYRLVSGEALQVLP